MIENNVIDGVGGSGVTLNNEIGSFYEGPLPSDTVVRNNTFKNTFFDSIKIYTNGKGAMARNMTIKGNHITGWHTDPKAKSASAISLQNVVGAVIKENTIGPGPADPVISKPIRLQNCSEVVNSGKHYPGDD